MSVPWRAWTLLTAALLLLNASVTFDNVWPTPAITWSDRLSIELAIVVFALSAAAISGREPSRRALRLLSVGWLALALGRYADVTSPALYGRDVNLYWDLRFVPDVVSMVTRVLPLWLTVSASAAAVLAVAALYAIVRWSFGRVALGVRSRTERRLILVMAIAAAMASAGLRASRGEPFHSVFSPPVTRTYLRQATFIAEAVGGSKSLPASPSMDVDIARVQASDVFLVFIEAYGAASFERPAIAARLAASRQRLERAIRDTHRDVASAFVESPTFGGSSWLAHITLMSGVEVRDPDTNAQLMTQHRETVVRAFGRSGFRTVALMPGLRRSWPEGVFYGFDEIYGAERLAYRGPEFGWFAIPDQFSLERLDGIEGARAGRQPLFVFFPTISTHFPFSPTPPYQPDWSRMDTQAPYDGPDLVRAYSRQPEWTDLTDGYATAIAYDLDTMAGYLRLHAGRALVMILIGDHQPAAAVSGEGAPWDVPVHVIASRSDVLDRLVAKGFRRGLTPARPDLSKMNALLPVLLDAFADPVVLGH